MTKGTFIDGPWTARKDFELDYSNVHRDGSSSASCPGCGDTVTCNRWAGIGEGPTGWCGTCNKAVQGPLKL